MMMMVKSKSPHQVHSLLVRTSMLQDPRVDSLLYSVTNFLVTYQKRAHSTSTSPDLSSKNPLLTDFLMKSLEFPHHKAATISSRFPRESTQKPELVIRYFKSLGLSTAHMQSAVRREPRVLYADVDKILKPKVDFCQELGLRGPHLPILISKNPKLLTSSLDKKLKPSIGVIKRVLECYRGESTDDEINLLLFHILSRYGWDIGNEARLESNIAYLKSCGIVGSQLIMLLKTELRLFSMREPELKGLVSQAVEMGFQMGSRMLVYGVHALYSNSPETISRKFGLFEELGFRKEECSLMFVKAPVVFKASEDKLRRSVDFFINTLGFNRSLLVGSPFLLKLSLERRMVPRFRVMELVKSRGVLKRHPSFVTVVLMTEDEFVNQFVSKYAKDLKVAYEKWRLGSS
ncbi:Mitochondrial transcription termination factor family protein [Striga hermonthica]|uniref:Mitochondrial transcription termination factor family protein n=1 Tax=Striga hermonthica TaxID=68872 RepID=A0A9N7RI79_STRHE|nr:Mitochondrial transcription termination factor family protein [Striga hermonthica]